MTSLLNRLFGRRNKGSGATAKSRLRFVLQHDRINLPPERMEMMKREILDVIVKYLVVDKERIEIDLEQRDRTHSKLVAEIPIAPGPMPTAPRDAVVVITELDGAEPNGSDPAVEDKAAADKAVATDNNKPEAKSKPAAEASADSEDDEKKPAAADSAD